MSYIVLSKNETLNDRVRVAENDIECYKVIEERLTSSGRYEYKTLPMYVEIPEDVATGKKSFIPHGDWMPQVLSDCLVKFEKGFVHAYKNYADALNYMEYHFNGYAECRPVIYCCIIPKGTQYFKTLRDFGNEQVTCYASYALRFDKPLVERVGGITEEYQRMIKQEKKKKLGIVFDDSYIKEENNFQEE